MSQRTPGPYEIVKCMWHAERTGVHLTGVNNAVDKPLVGLAIDATARNACLWRGLSTTISLRSIWPFCTRHADISPGKIGSIEWRQAWPVGQGWTLWRGRWASFADLSAQGMDFEMSAEEVGVK